MEKKISFLSDIKFYYLLNQAQNINLDKIPYSFYQKIYNYYKPKPRFKKRELCIRMCPNINKEQAVRIEVCYEDNYVPGKGYLYYYGYYPASEGYAYEYEIRKLKENEKGKSIFNLPMGLSPKISWD
tara:strand:- start:362 stop:742 length:381 start_codon:yes stop_codon:yes gene_type:complete